MDHRGHGSGDEIASAWAVDCGCMSAEISDVGVARCEGGV